MKGTDVKEIKKLVKKFNQPREGLYLTEFSLYQVFGGGEELTEQNLPLRLWAVNGLWDGGVRRPGHMHTIFEKLVENLVSVNAKIVEVRDFDYRNDDVEPLLVDAVPDTFSLIYNATPGRHNATPGRHHSAFAAKFFHWCAPEAFPIIDSNARKAIRKFQKDNDWPEDQILPENDPLTPENYKSLIHFYKEFIVEMVGEHNGNIEELIQHDLDTQVPEFHHKNTILRVLDKYFWMKGKSMA